MLPTFKEFLAEAMDPERKRALNAALKQLEKQYGRTSMLSDEGRENRKQRERQEASREKYRKAQEEREAEHQRRMETDPEYRREQEQKLKDTEAFWKSYGEARAKNDPRIVSKDGWTGD